MTDSTRRGHGGAPEAVNRGWYSRRDAPPDAGVPTSAPTKNAVWQNSTPIDVPMFIAHGTTDTVLPVVHGYALAEMYPAAELLIIEGMCHELQPHYFEELWPRWACVPRRADG